MAKWYAEELRFTAKVSSRAVVTAFTTVPREHFVGPGPWRILSPMYTAGYWTTEDDDPRRIKALATCPPAASPIAQRKMLLSLVRPLPEASSSLTPRWSERDSNRWSHPGFLWVARSTAVTGNKVCATLCWRKTYGSGLRWSIFHIARSLEPQTGPGSITVILMTKASASSS
jgi:hypothetical protein